jgi:hypothetical protein
MLRSDSIHRARIFCRDAQYQPVTTAESVRRVDETSNHFRTTAVSVLRA